MKQCTAPEAHEQATTGNAVILDVRGDDERMFAAIPGSLHIPLHELRARAEELPKDRTIICQCASGMRSAQAAGFLDQAGYDAVNLHGGIGMWARHGLPMEGA